MSNLSQARKNYIFTTKINLPDGDDYIVLREPTMAEISKFGDDEKKNVESMDKMLPSCIIEHSFTNDDGTPSKNDDVANLLRDSSHIYTEIVNTWFNSLPFRSAPVKQEN